MAVINHAKREINAKLVYYGPAGSGKASLFRYIHQRIKPSLCGPLKSMPAGGDALLFFDYLPFEHANLEGYRIRFHLYTLTGPVINPGTWKMTLKGVDGLALVAESGHEQGEQTIQALRSLRTILAGHGRDLQRIPCVLLTTKADQDASHEPAWSEELSGMTVLQSSIVTGEGVLQTLAALSQEVMQHLRREQAEMASERQAFSTEQPCQPSNEELTAAVPVQSATDAIIEAAPVVRPGEAASLRLPVTLEMAGELRRFTLRVTLDLEEVADGSLNV